MSAKPVGKKAIYSHLNDQYVRAADGNNASFVESSYSQNNHSAKVVIAKEDIDGMPSE